jgi:hypothetical protein
MTRERSIVARERGSVAVVRGDTEIIGAEAGGAPTEGRDRAERFNAELPDIPAESPAEIPGDTPENHAAPVEEQSYTIGTCRICQLGIVVQVNLARRGGAKDIHAFCLFCQRTLDPHEVEPRV